MSRRLLPRRMRAPAARGRAALLHAALRADVRRVRRLGWFDDREGSGPLGSHRPRHPDTRSGGTTITGGWQLKLAAAACAVVFFGGCGSEQDPTPERLDGSESYEFEQEDLDAAGAASDRVKEYCAGAVSEAQRLGCESHVTDEEIP